MRRHLPPDHIQRPPRDLPFLHRRLPILGHIVAGTDRVEDLCTPLRPGGGEDDVGEEVVGDYEGGGVVGGLGSGGGVGAEAEVDEKFTPGVGDVN